MLRNTVIVILIGVLAQTFFLPAVAFHLESTRETEAIPMCINKDTPDLNCLGSCYINIHLEAALNQQDQQSDSSQAPSTTGQWSPQLIAAITNLSFNTPIATINPPCFSLVSWHSQQQLMTIWRPPTSLLA